MKTIFNALRKSLKEPVFTVVRLIERQPDYYSYSSRKSRNEYGLDQGAIYAINVYPKDENPLLEAGGSRPS